MRVQLAFVCLFAFSVGYAFALPFLGTPFTGHDFYGRSIHLAAPEFTLEDLDGRAFGQADLTGTWTYLMFGYVDCDGLCQSQVLVLHQLRQALAGEATRFVFIAMDPVRDTPERLRQFLGGGADDTRVLRGATMGAVQAVARAWRAGFSRGPGTGVRDGTGTGTAIGNEYRIDHPGFVYLVDPGGVIRLVYAGRALRADRLRADLLSLKQQSF
ncbi:MAG: SCO family protein [Gammaproteobacteria bacterium]